jgi:tetratricopeptide (TPR) repeat protein
MPQWKDLAQRISYGSGFGGDVNNVAATPPEDLNQPFRISYDYTKKDYSEWGNRRISPPLPVMLLPDIKESKKYRKFPIWLGVPGEVHFRSTLELPKNYTPELPKNIDMEEDFAQYHAEYSVKDGALVTDRRLVFFVSEVPISSYEKYKAFVKRVNNDRDEMTSVTAGSTPKETPVLSPQEAQANQFNEWNKIIWSLPSSSNQVASQYASDARDALVAQDMTKAESLLRAAVDKDAKFTRAWLLLGWGLMYKNRPEAIQAFRGAVAADPTVSVSYKLLALNLMWDAKYEDAIPVLRQLFKIEPGFTDGPSNLALALSQTKRYGEAAAALETAVQLSPHSAYMQLQLGDAYLKAGDAQKARAAYHAAIEMDSSPTILNSVAYGLAEQRTELNTAQEYAEKAVHQEEETCGKLQLSNLSSSDLNHAITLVTFWDTLGWVYFRQNDLTRAEKYLSTAWGLSQDAVVGRHLGAVYEKQGKMMTAIHMYQLVHSAGPLSGPPISGSLTAKTDKGVDDDLRRLGAKPDSAKAVTELGQMRTFALPRIARGGTATFLVLLGPGNEAEAKFVAGADSLKGAEKAIAQVNYKFQSPDDHLTRVPRTGIVGCYTHSGCSIVLMTSSSSSAALSTVQ